jgi:hypothetical protein
MRYLDLAKLMTWVTRIEVLSSYNPIPGFQGGTVRHTLVKKTEKKGHQIGHYLFLRILTHMRVVGVASTSVQHIIQFLKVMYLILTLQVPLTLPSVFSKTDSVFLK